MWTGYGITVSVRVIVLKKAQVIQSGMRIEFTDAITYLGFPFTNSSNFPRKSREDR